MNSVLNLFNDIVNLYIWVLVINVILSWLVAFNILNTGNQTLKDFTFTETFKDLENNTKSLSSSITTSDPNELAPGQTKTYSATYVITQSDVDNGGLSNSVVVVASNLTNNIFVNDTSDDGDTGAGNTNSDPTIYQIAADPSLDVTKTFLDIPLGSGPYKVENLDPGRQIKYERVKNYWAKDLPVNKGQYNFDYIIYDYYKDVSVLIEAFKVGDYDYRREY